VWEFVGDDYTDTMLVSVSGPVVLATLDTLEASPFADWTYEFPMTAGNHWGFDFILPVPVVEDKVAVITPAGHFPTCFHYKATGSDVPQVSWVVNNWLAPQVGLVKRTILITISGNTIIQEWTLLSFDAP
jgi:hypothetical protein